jgi:ABC-type antimicrobial peptide transport system permease subunit
MTTVVSRSLAGRQFALMALSLFAFVALGLAVIGLYGVLSHAVIQRTPELGLRLALGASPARLLTMVLGEGLRLTALGTLIGGIAGLALARAMSGLLFGVAALDPLAFSGSIVLLLAVAAAASLVPARRASGADPMIALRSE